MNAFLFSWRKIGHSVRAGVTLLLEENGKVAFGHVPQLDIARPCRWMFH
jgi:hypothetical protein